MSVLNLLKLFGLNPDSHIKPEAVEKLTDQIRLTEIAKNNSNWKVREAAVKKLTDQKLLADIAKHDAVKWVNLAAVQKMTDQFQLTEIAKHVANEMICIAAAEKLTDTLLAQTIFTKIAKQGQEWRVRKQAVEKLTYKADLLDISKRDIDDDVRIAAGKRLQEIEDKLF